MKVLAAGQPLIHVIDFINMENASDIVSSILLSVGISFSVGWIVQYVARFFFTYDYVPKLRYMGGIF